MSITFSMRREGQFTATFSTRGNQCGQGGQQIYTYVCEIEVGEKLDAHGFILDNYQVQGYFDREYSNKRPDAGPAQSCERIAQLASAHFAKILTREGRAPKRVSVTIKGSAFAGLTATWEEERPAAPVEIVQFDGAATERRVLDELTPDLGTADVWHAGSKSFYRAKLLRKLTLNEALADPTDDQNIDYDAAAETRVLERVKNDPATQLFGLSLTEIQTALSEYDARRTQPANVIADGITLPSKSAPEQLVCDHCHKPVELDGGHLRYGGGREDYRHKGYGNFPPVYACSLNDEHTHATVNGQDYVIKAQPEPAPTPVCDYCHEPVESDKGELNISGREDWIHSRTEKRASNYPCFVNGTRHWAAVNGSEEVPKPTPTPSPEPQQAIDRTRDHVHKFTIERSNFRVCEVCNLSDVYVKNATGFGQEAQAKKTTTHRCDNCAKEIVPDELNVYWRHKDSELYSCQLPNQAELYGTDRVERKAA